MFAFKRFHYHWYCHSKNTIRLTSGRNNPDEVEYFEFKHREEVKEYSDVLVDVNALERIQVYVHRATPSVAKSFTGSRMEEPPEILSKKAKSLGDIAVASKEKTAYPWTPPSPLSTTYILGEPLATIGATVKWSPKLHILQFEGIPPLDFAEWRHWAKSRLTSQFSVDSLTPNLPCYTLPEEVSAHYVWRDKEGTNADLQKIIAKYNLLEVSPKTTLLCALSHQLFGNDGHVQLLQKITGHQTNPLQIVQNLRDFFEVGFAIFSACDQNPVLVPSHFPYSNLKAFAISCCNSGYAPLLPPKAEPAPTEADIVDLSNIVAAPRPPKPAKVLKPKDEVVDLT